MTNVEIVSEYNLWKKNIKNPKTYFKKKLKKLTKFKSLNFSSKTFTILLTNNIKMKYLNNKFRKKNKTTDILSFPFNYKFNKNSYLGDMAISYEIVNKRSINSNFFMEFDKMWIHGYLHLLGYDHKILKNFQKMNKKENLILNYFYKKN